MMFWCGVALAMKFQAIFIAPFALGALLTLRPKWWHWLVPAGSYMLCLLPALVAGWPLSDLFTVYFRQTQFYGVQMVLNAPNPWVIISFLHLGNPAMEFWVAKGLALIAGLLIVRKIQISEVKPDNLIALALLSAITMPYLLPAMHERYFFLADILSICLYVAKRDTRSLLTAIFVQLGSFAAIFAFITGETTWAKLSTGEVVLQLYNAHDLRYGLVSVASMTIAVVLVLIRIHAIPRASTQA
jgi:Gpi18-like mannosyltransferase